MGNSGACTAPLCSVALTPGFNALLNQHFRSGPGISIACHVDDANRQAAAQKMVDITHEGEQQKGGSERDDGHEKKQWRGELDFCLAFQ